MKAIHLNRSPMRATLRRVTLTLGASLALLCVGLLAGCTKGDENILKPGPTIPGLNLSGGFDCQEFGFMKLRQTGLTLQGTYDGIRKNGDNGTIRGKIEGDLVWFDWIQPGNMDAAVWPKSGKGWLRISRDGNTLKGRWGYDQDREGAGLITLSRSDFVFEE